MKETILPLFCSLTIFGSILIHPPRKLGDRFSTNSLPFVLSPYKQLKLTTYQWTSQDHLKKQGIIFNLVDVDSPNMKVMDGLKSASSVIPFSSDPRFLDQALHIFSKPCVKSAVFLEWTDGAGKVRKHGYDHPDRVTADLDGPNFQKLHLDFRMEEIDLDHPPCLLTIWKVSENPFIISAERLKEALDHITGRPFSDWTIAQIANKLAHDSTYFKIYLRVPNNSSEAAMASRQHLEYFDVTWTCVKEVFDPELKFLIQSRLDGTNLKSITIISLKNPEVRFWFVKPFKEDYSTALVGLSRDRNRPIVVPARMVMDIILRLTGLEISEFAAARIASSMLKANRYDRTSLFIRPDIDAKIWQLLRQRTTTDPPRLG